MKDSFDSTVVDSVDAALAAIALRLTPVGGSRWTMALVQGEPECVTAMLMDDWLVIEADLKPGGALGGPGIFWDALGWNAALPGLAKLAITGGGGWRLLAELPVQESVALSERVRESCAGFEAARVRLQPGAGSAPEFTAPEAPALEPMDLRSLCSEAGWPFIERAGGTLAVDLDLPTSFYQALLVPSGRGLRIGCDLATLDGAPPVCRRAIGGFLLAASGAVRLARAAITSGELWPVARFEVVFATPPCPSEISSALESLHVGCGLCGEEIKTLQDPIVAQHYLELQGWVARTTIDQKENTP